MIASTPLDGSVPDEELRWMIDHSHGLVVDGLGGKARALLGLEED